MARPVELLNDLVDEILYRVPATSLKRLRATCKRWNRLFKDDRRFGSEHRDKAAKEIHSLILTEKCRICPVSINLPNGDVPPSLEVKKELSLPHPHFNNSSQYDIANVCHCDGLLLCNPYDGDITWFGTKIVVWNPFTGQTRWIEARNRKMNSTIFVLGYYYKQDKNKNKSCSKRSYKILCFGFHGEDIEIYELNSNDSWRRLPDGDLTPPGWSIDCSANDYVVFLTGSAYFFAKEKSKPQLSLSLVRFDFSTEKSSLFVALPRQYPRHEVLSLSVVGEEKLSVFLQPNEASKAEIWVTSKIDVSTKVVSGSKVLAVDLSPDLQITSNVHFLLDEDKKVAVCSERWMEDENKSIDKTFFLGEDNKVRELGFGQLDWVDAANSPVILNYVPSLVQIELPAAGCNKRKRGD
ncbi:PREDICTED: F-box protein ETP1-like [Camelina sativa]|uniref:F-box protein ETP1-like n=1 Tax=Camelina sativa TaxID=90675 RepID=A0ABM0WAU7_CAMSA|nr:PREDICTED: F-box protein ETP1-like [Camelina sativa]